MSILRNQGRIILAAIAILCGGMTEVRAGTITAAEIVQGCGTEGHTLNPLVLIDITKIFNSLCSMDIRFTVTNTNAANDIRFRENVLNSTRLTWFDYHMQLGFGSGTGFTPVAQNCGVAFTATEMATSTHFALQGENSALLNWAGGPVGRVPPFQSVGFLFTVRVDDLSPCIPLGSRLANGYRFTLRQTPTIPEPATVLLLGTGLAGVAIKMRKRLKKSG